MHRPRRHDAEPRRLLNAHAQRVFQQGILDYDECLGARSNNNAFPFWGQAMHGGVTIEICVILSGDLTGQFKLIEFLRPVGHVTRVMSLRPAALSRP